MDDYDVDVELLICLIRDRPALWDKTCELYKNKTHCQKEWKEIGIAFRPDLDGKSLVQSIELHVLLIALREKWSYLRKSWIKWKSTEKNDESKNFTNTEISNILKNILFNGDSKCNGLDEKSNMVDEKYQELPQVSKPPANQPCQSVPVLFESPKMKSVKRKAVDYDIDTPRSSTRLNTNSLGSENRHLLFFKGILPSLENFNDDQTVKFQIAVLNVIQDMRNKKGVS